jgi:hypothetical protein
MEDVIAKFLAELLAAIASSFFDFEAKRADQPTVIKDPAHDPQEDEFDREFKAASVAGAA